MTHELVIIDGQIQPTMSQRQDKLAEADALGLGPEITNQIRFAPFEFDPARPVLCVGTDVGRIGQDRLLQGAIGATNLDFACPLEGVSNFQSQVGDFFGETGEDIQAELDRAEAQINRTDEELADIRDEARESVSGIGKFFKFLGFAIVGILVVVIISIVAKIFFK